ncbi:MULTISPECIES: DNA polymerase III subunit gamma/tau [unclassified Janthinobacterium]|uniref:DNA polymerase III subunit gamma/tau n=1 Tax=unclassified Janthinobacterium TaxID=2610881 RepID=UPI0008833611|nr:MULTISPECIES: DNA polymerase III subunit gamma/tau [unclassified Janthinobacterium]SDA76171.1 DNA polymerase-3 subunit gamma/tau [Janthinobacterium sp. 551a]SFB61341.1 DNA polymerase-3 subunit gamma/tau [Janthinobacterium sp. 344]
MSYQVLARKYRPKNFETLVGQEHVVRALTHALHSGRLHHAYLFTGTRGVGKTTLSRILAKSLNCIGLDGTGGITAQPCGQCEACTAIDAGRFVDYIEMDAASNRGVDEMAQLLEQAVYAPSNARFKVYMIDEVHMLTNHAFNAMLKTLEEPPEHVKFILATTDPQKIPVTVLSRCLQFNLKQMPPGHIISHLDNILGQEGIAFEQPALRLLAQGAHGSMRDALSLTDQAIAYAAGEVTLDAVQGMLGALDQSYLVRLLDALAQQDGADLLAVADEMASRSLSYNGALQDLGTLLHRIALAQTVPAALPQDLPEYADIVRLAGAFDAEEVQLFYQIAVHGRNELGLAPDEYAGFTMTLLRMLAFRPGIGGADGVPAAAPAAAPGNRPAAVAAARAAAGASAPAARAATNSVASHAAVTPPAVVAAAAASMARSEAPPPRAAAPAPAPAPVTAPAPAAPPPAAPVPAAAAAPAASGAPISSARAAINAALEAARAASKGRPGSAPSAPSSAPKPAAAPAPAAEPVAAAAPAAPVQAAPPAAPAAAKAPAPWDDAPPVAVMDAPAAAPAQPVRQAPPQQAPADDDLPPWVTEFSDDSASVAVSAPASGPAEQPAVIMPQRAAKQAAPSGPYVITPVPGLDWDGNWPAVAAVLPLRGVAQQLAVQAELIECLHDGHSTTFRLRVPIDTWRSPANVEKLAAALSERFGRKVNVDTELGAVWYTASAEAQAHREACQLAAEETIASDPFVLDMKRAFDAFVVPGTITPAPAGSAAPTLH